jgi:hypothetical protein
MQTVLRKRKCEMQAFAVPSTDEAAVSYLHKQYKLKRIPHVNMVTFVVTAHARL